MERGDAGAVLLGGGVADFALAVDADLHQVGGPGQLGGVLRPHYPAMVEWQQFLLMGGPSFVGTIGGSLLTAPTPVERLRHFYQTTRPFGRWGPVRAPFTPDAQRELTKEHRADLTAVPFALLWQVTLFILPMQLSIKAYGSFWRTLPLFLVALAGMYFFWYRKLPRAERTAEAARRFSEHEVAAD